MRIHALMDDASRYVIALEAMTYEREIDMLSVFVRAVRKHGPPDAMYLDNGATYRGETLSLSCARMGTTLVHSKPYDAPARGKIERFWRTLREGCLDHIGSLTSLHALNVRLWAWLDEHYHKTPHGALMGKTPLEVFTAAASEPDPFDERKLRAALTVHARRRVRRDNTIAMDGVDWETDLHFLAGQLVSVSRCLVDPSEPPFIDHEGKRFVLHPVDPVRNATRPRSAQNLDEPHVARVAFDPSRALLDKALGRKPEGSR
ncbi:integrase core domain-containing protein [Pendulispora albinea]|uniref:Integrase core domain-containing protein n=1 Tax=Pendulispora albinea TaxID=2741071 RepID=A0ABZ2LVL0_9BACT